MLRFDAALQAGVLSVLQPDAAKWGGISGCWPVIRRARAAGLRYCPHYLGAGVGLLASAHLLAAAGGDGSLEVDANDNPLRTAVAPALQHLDEDGCVSLGDAAGIGVEPDPQRIAEAIRAAAG
ncbi:enolase C-terminal domain-like protein [Variovorax sp. J2P1-59]|uniref:enolase C-terminal domain-like protein n=1 Tax=Variovorax flavidus TaxID=3053501 RepID=UPI0025785421|nr:enolase C-terminal domain-like protein [Variovorax sp. J2P1-59]MDM0078151.1 enolase C-terminal domain-like protein [Variovorax sp. J2P1-59]